MGQKVGKAHFTEAAKPFLNREYIADAANQ